MNLRTVLIGFVSMIASGALLVLALPPGHFGWCAVFAFAPVIAVSRRRGFLVGFILATAAIFVGAWISSVGLLYTVRHPIGEAGWTYTGFGLFGFAAALAVAVSADKGVERMPTWWLAALATLLEACLLLLLPANLGLSLYRNPAALWLASLGGIWVVSFLLWWANFAIARNRVGWAWALCAGGLLFVTGLIPVPAGSGPSAKLACVQVADIDDVAHIRDLYKQASAMKPEIVVMPEFGGMMFTKAGDPQGLRDLSRLGAPLVTSYQDGFSPLPHNAAALFTAGIESQPYFKRKLFGGEKTMHTPGSKPVAAPWRFGQIGLAICYDSCFPEAMREAARLPGVTAIALPTIDPEAPNDFLAAVHSASTPFRAAEEDVAIVRADGMAYSQVVSAGGRIEAEAGSGDQVLTGSARLGGGMTAYKRFGDWILWLCGGLVLAGTWRTRRR